MKALWVILGVIVGGAVFSTGVVGLAILWAWMLGDSALSPEPVYFFAGLLGLLGATVGGFFVGIGVDL